MNITPFVMAMIYSIPNYITNFPIKKKLGKKFNSNYIKCKDSDCFKHTCSVSKRKNVWF